MHWCWEITGGSFFFQLRWVCGTWGNPNLHSYRRSSPLFSDWPLPAELLCYKHSLGRGSLSWGAKKCRWVPGWTARPGAAHPFRFLVVVLPDGGGPPVRDSSARTEHSHSARPAGRPEKLRRWLSDPLQQNNVKGALLSMLLKDFFKRRKGENQEWQ